MKKFLIIVGMLMLLTIPLTVVSAGELEAINNREENRWEFVDISQYISGEGAVCTGYDEKVNTPGEYLGEVNLVVTAEKVTWSANPGYIITAVCIKEGGQGGGTLYTPNVSDGEYVKQFHDISHAAISWEVEPTPPPTPSVSVSAEGCVFEGQTMDVTLTITGAIVTITGPNDFEETFDESTTISLPIGTYSYTYIAAAGYEGHGDGSFTVNECDPAKATADISTGACVWDEENGSLTEVIITLNNATLTIDGETYEESTSIKLGPGSYPYSWVGTGNSEDQGSGTLVVEDCSPKEEAEAEISLGSCKWNGDESLTEVAFTLSGASLTITGSSGQGSFGPYTESGAVDLPAGEYTYSWTATGDFTGAGEGKFTLVSCEPGEASASVTLGSCGFVDGTSLTPVTITVNQASLTINGVTYTEAATIELEPGEYDYTWTANEEGYTGEGSGTLIVDSCEPKEEEEEKPVDPEPDVAAGGSGPSLIYFMAPATLGISSLGLAWMMLKKKLSNR